MDANLLAGAAIPCRQWRRWDRGKPDVVSGSPKLQDPQDGRDKRDQEPF